MAHEVSVVGAGICGMSTALALARAGHSVTLYERDTAPPEGDADAAFFEWQRRGAAQFRHPHAFLGLMCNVLAENYPDLLSGFLDAGARKLSFADMLPPALQADYQPEEGDDRLWVLLCRRATIETVLRRYVEKQDNIRIVNGVHITGVKTEQADGHLIVRGIVVADRKSPPRTVTSDLIVDASGRASKFYRWLQEAGATVTEERDDAEIVYYTRHYRLNEGFTEPPRNSKHPSAGDLGYLKFGVFPGDNGHFAIIVCAPIQEQWLRDAIKDGKQFDAICRTIPGLAQWLEPGMAEPTTRSFGIGEIHAVWRHYWHDDESAVLNFFPIGDAVVRTNPLYGRGCSTGTLHAHILADVLAETADPVERARNFYAQTEAQLRPIFKASLDEDRRGIRRASVIREGGELEQAKTFKQRMGLAFGDALAAAAREQVHVIRGLQRTVNLLEKPGAFLDEWPIKLTVMRYMLRGRKRNNQARLQRGPNRQEMMAHVAEYSA